MLRYSQIKRYSPRTPAGQSARSSEPPQGVKKGEVKVKTPSTSELLVQEAREAERLRILLLADECKTLEEFKQRLRDLLNSK